MAQDRQAVSTRKPESGHVGVHAVGTFLRIGLGVAFLTAAVAKLGDIERFIASVAELHLLPGGVVIPASYVLSLFELILGTFLVVGLFERRCSAAAIVLLGAFVVIIGVPVAQGRQIQCGCFGSSSYATWETVARQIALIVAACFHRAMAGSGRLWGLDRVWGNRRAGLGVQGSGQA